MKKNRKTSGALRQENNIVPGNPPCLATFVVKLFHS